MVSGDRATGLIQRAPKAQTLIVSYGKAQKTAYNEAASPRLPQAPYDHSAPSHKAQAEWLPVGGEHPPDWPLKEAAPV